MESRLGIGIVAKVVGIEIFRQEEETEFFVNEGLDVYDMDGLRENFTTQEIQNNDYYIIGHGGE